jgi:aspartyl-tRNA synthetase
MGLEELVAQIGAQGAKVAEMKKAKAPKDEVTAEVQTLLALKDQLPDGHELKPKPKGKKGQAPAAAPAAKNAAPPKKAKEAPKPKPAPPKAAPAEATGSSLVDCAQYFAQHKIEGLFDDLAKALAHEQPADPQTWLATQLGGVVGPKASSAADKLSTGYRTHTCGELRQSHVGQTVTLSGWVQASRDQKHFCFIDIRDRYGITQIVCDNNDDANTKAIYETAKNCGREWVIQITGVVRERSNKNMVRPTGAIEVAPTKLEVLNQSKVPPFKIEDKTDGGYDVRLDYRYLDLRRNPVKEALLLRNRVTIAVRELLNGLDFCEVETPYLIKSTPEGARDFVVPCREQEGKFYALPQSPQTFKQLIMVGGMDRYFQIVKCFRDEGTVIAQNRQPEFTQIDCEMSYVTQDDVLRTFEAMMCNVFRKVANVELPPFKRLSFDEVMEDFGIDKPDMRFEMKLKDLSSLVQGKGSPHIPFLDTAEAVIALCVEKPETMDNAKWEKGFYAKKNLDKLQTIEFIEEHKLLGEKKKVGTGLVWCKVIDRVAAKFETPVKKNYSPELLETWAEKLNAPNGSVMILLAGCNKHLETRMAVGKLRHHFGTQLGLRANGFSALWVMDFPLLEWDEDAERCVAMHHPFTSTKEESREAFFKCQPGDDPAQLEGIRANAYDMVINGQEVGGGSIRIHDATAQKRMFELLGMSPEEYQHQFGFILDAFENGVPPHGGLAFGLDRLCTILGAPQYDPATVTEKNPLGDLIAGIPQQLDCATGASIRDYMAFPKTKGGGDAMIKTPCYLAQSQLDELKLAVTCEIREETEGSAAEGNAAESGIDVSRMAEIQAALDALQAKAPPNPRGKPSKELLAQMKAHAEERGQYEATMSPEELKFCQEASMYVRGAKKPDKKKGKK